MAGLQTFSVLVSSSSFDAAATFSLLSFPSPQFFPSLPPSLPNKRAHSRPMRENVMSVGGQQPEREDDGFTGGRTHLVIAHTVVVEGSDRVAATSARIKKTLS